MDASQSWSQQKTDCLCFSEVLSFSFYCNVTQIVMVYTVQIVNMPERDQ